MWYKAAKPYLESGEFAILGVVQEQHAERAQLYKQWKQYDFPIAQDATTELNLNAVPIPVLIDQYGVVRKVGAKPNDLISFIKRDYQAPGENTTVAKPTDNEVATLIGQGNEIVRAEAGVDFDKAIAKFGEAVAKDSENGSALFGLGVVYRMRFDESGNPDDFVQASKNWALALKSNPNQYIWRRRIEQYGPRLAKPYPFYDWVEKANEEIKERGQVPVSLKVELTGTEVTSPRAPVKDGPIENPDPESKIAMDKKFLNITATCVPSAQKDKTRMRIHLHCNVSGAKWNNEAPSMQVWIDESSSGTPESRLIEDTGHSSESSLTDLKTVDFEFRLADKSKSDKAVRGYVLFHCCDDNDVCYYYRKNFDLPIEW